MTTGHEWARDLVGAKAIVFHPGTQAAGRAAEYFDGEVDRYVSPVNDQPVGTPVLLLDTGHAVTAPTPESVVVLTQSEAAFYEGAGSLLSLLLTNSVQLGARANIPVLTMTNLLVSMLRTQAGILEAGSARLVRG